MEMKSVVLIENVTLVKKVIITYTIQSSHPEWGFYLWIAPVCGGLLTFAKMSSQILALSQGWRLGVGISIDKCITLK